jgi:hypothetical protein
VMPACKASAVARATASCGRSAIVSAFCGNALFVKVLVVYPAP